jgi:glycosyltransferase involved in cell wall biosynthesis
MASSGSRRLRVLTLVDLIGTTGGAERLAHLLTTHLDRSRFEPTFCVTRWKHLPEHEPALAELRDAGVPFIGLERHSRFQLRPWRELTAAMRDWRVDILHSHKFGSNVWGALLAPRLGASVFVAHEQTWSFQGQRFRQFLDRNLIGRRADAFVAVSSEDRRRMIEVEGVPESKIRLIPNAIATPPPPDPHRDVRRLLGLGPDQPVVGIVAKLRRQKALDVLIRAVPLLREATPSVAVIIVGGPAVAEEGEEERLHGLARDLGLSDELRFLGERSDVPDVVGLFDVAVLCSDYEGSPLAVMEYMEAGKPVVATRVGGVPDLVEDGVTGLLVDPQDPDGLASAIVSLLRDPDRAARMGRAGRELRRRSFSIEGMVRRFEELYVELYASNSSSAASSLRS